MSKSHHQSNRILYYGSFENPSRSRNTRNPDDIYSFDRIPYSTKKKRRYCSYNDKEEIGSQDELNYPRTDSVVTRASHAESNTFIKKKFNSYESSSSSTMRFPDKDLDFAEQKSCPTWIKDQKTGENNWPNGLFNPIAEDNKVYRSNFSDRSISPLQNWRHHSIEYSLFTEEFISCLMFDMDEKTHSSSDRYVTRKKHEQDLNEQDWNEQEHSEADKNICSREPVDLAKNLTGSTTSNPWSERLKELLKYKSHYGDCLVPQKFSLNQQLGSWVNKQRVEYKLMQEGKRSSMTKERAEILEKVGFVWSKNLSQPSWDSKYRELLLYKEEHGDCLVPTKYSYNPSLGRWVSTQRAQYKLLKEGSKSSMTEDRLKRLEGIGFVWRLHF